MQNIKTGTRPQLILFDLLTALLDSWAVWDNAAGSSDMGRRWRMSYLKQTYGCGAYRPYETLVAEAAQSVGLDMQAVHRLQESWQNLSPWPEVAAVLHELRQYYRLGVVTNCSEQLGQVAAARVGVPFDVVVTSARAGFYKPDPRPYQLALDMAQVTANQAIFVAGSAYDLFGTAKVGLTAIWHNRIGLQKPVGAPDPVAEIPDLGMLPTIIKRLNST